MTSKFFTALGAALCLIALPAAAAPTTAPTPALPAAGLVLPAGSLPPPATAAAFATAVSGPLAATLADRLTLSPTTATLLTENAATAAGKPTVEFTLNLLSALTGEPRSRVQLLAFGNQTPGDPAAVAGLAAKGATDLLQLLVRGTVAADTINSTSFTFGSGYNTTFKFGNDSLGAFRMERTWGAARPTVAAMYLWDNTSDSWTHAGSGASYQQLVCYGKFENASFVNWGGANSVVNQIIVNGKPVGNCGQIAPARVRALRERVEGELP